MKLSKIAYEKKPLKVFTSPFRNMSHIIDSVPNLLKFKCQWIFIELFTQEKKIYSNTNL